MSVHHRLGPAPDVGPRAVPLAGLGELGWRTPWGSSSQSRRRTVLVVRAPPSLDPVPGVGHGPEPGRVRAFRPLAGVERFEQPIIGRSAGPGEVDPNPVQVGHGSSALPANSGRRQLRRRRAPLKRPRPAALGREPVQDLDHPVGPQARPRHRRERLARVAVDHGQDPVWTAVEQLVLRGGGCRAGWVRPSAPCAEPGAWPSPRSARHGRRDSTVRRSRRGSSRPGWLSGTAVAGPWHRTARRMPPGRRA